MGSAYDELIRILPNGDQHGPTEKLYGPDGKGSIHHGSYEYNGQFEGYFTAPYIIYVGLDAILGNTVPLFY